MNTSAMTAALLLAAASAFGQVAATQPQAAAPADSSKQALLGQIEAWRAMELPRSTPPDATTTAFEPRLNEIRTAVAAAGDDADLEKSRKDFEAWKASVLQAKYAVACSRGLARGGYAQFALEQTQMAEFSAALSRAMTQAAEAAKVGATAAASLGAAHDPSSYFDGARMSGSRAFASSPSPFSTDASVVTVPAPYDAKDPRRYAKVRSILISQGARAKVVDLAIKEAIAQNADPLLVLAVIKQESGFSTRATSPVGAIGLMQIMPDTGRGLGVRDASLLYDAKTNLHAGVKFLKSLWGEFVGGQMSLAGINPFSSHQVKAAVAAYNAGAGAVEKYNGVPPYRETQGYVKAVLGYYNQFKQYLNA
jgi:soluble lytic murein transglycosylase-like protein